MKIPSTLGHSYPSHPSRELRALAALHYDRGSDRRFLAAITYDRVRLNQPFPILEGVTLMLSLVLILSSVLQAQETNLQNSATRANSKGDKSTQAKTETPEQALRTFLFAMAIKDVETLRSVTLPTKDFDWLLKGEGVPPDHIDEFKQIVAKIPIRSLKPGDDFTLPRNRKMKVRPDEVGPDRAVLLPENAPMPNRLQKIEGHWRVDATPIVAGRKAAEAARMKAKPSNR